MESVDEVALPYLIALWLQDVNPLGRREPSYLLTSCFSYTDVREGMFLDRPDRQGLLVSLGGPAAVEGSLQPPCAADVSCLMGRLGRTRLATAK